MTENIKTPDQYIVPLTVNSLRGRVLTLPAKTEEKRKIDILFIYGHHSSLERWWGLIQAYSRYGNIIAPDLPGFGGMDSLYKIGKKPSIDNLADYLAAVIDQEYKDRKLTVLGLSFGFVVITRMLQRRPDLIKNITFLVSIVGFTHNAEFTFSKSRRRFYLTAATAFSVRPFSTFFRYVILNSFILRTFYAKMHNAKNKFSEDLTKAEFNQLMDVEISLWHDNEIRTYMYTTIEMLRLDNTKLKVDLPVWHIYAKNDHFFNNGLIEQHMNSIFSEYNPMPTDLVNHAPSVIADEKTAAELIPTELDILLNNKFKDIM